MLLASAALFCAACSDVTDGQATGTPPPSSSSTQSIPATSAGSASPMQGKTEFTETELCDLLTSEEVQQLGGGTDEGKATMNVVTEAPLCQWVGATALTVTYRPDGVIKNLESGPTIKKKMITVVGLDAVLSDNTKSGGFCQVGANLTDHSELVVGVGIQAAGESKYDRCTVAKQMATIVFSKLK